MRKFFTSFVVLTFVFVGTVGVAQAQGFLAKQRAESEKVKEVKGGAKILVLLSAQETYDSLLTWVKRADYSLDSSETSKDNGVIVTALAVDPKDKGKATRTVLTVIKDSETQTTVKVVVYRQKRRTMMGSVGLWGNAELLDAEIKDLATKLDVYFNSDPKK